MAKNAHLTYDERLTIQSSLAEHLSFKAIGLIIGKDLGAGPDEGGGRRGEFGFLA